PRSLGWLPDLGIAILEALPGTSLRHRLDSGVHSLPSSQSLTNILDQMPDMPATAPGLVERLNAHRRFLDVIVPAESSRIARIVDEVATSPAEPIVPAHNDFHAAQVMVSGGAITGLVDIDTLGSGHRADDYAMFLGHLYTNALVSKRGEELAAYGAQLLSGFERQISRTSLRLRTAAAVVGFATAPFRSQQADWPTAISKRLASAEAWLESSAAA
ncbi:MAG: aminoglycoside phosphotransferase family protein, partial [Acidimicrobiia bacterium]|nr:aminoglycoside phosphotransferase family protein [Acidimicrobiia bacterium]